jgi:hypothetical protein
MDAVVFAAIVLEVKRMNGSRLSRSPKLTSDLDHQQYTQGIVTTKQVIFQLLQQQLHGEWKELFKGISFEGMTTDDMCIDDGIDQVLQTTLQEAFVWKGLMFARGHVCH